MPPTAGRAPWPGRDERGQQLVFLTSGLGRYVWVAQGSPAGRGPSGCASDAAPSLSPGRREETERDPASGGSRWDPGFRCAGSHWPELKLQFCETLQGEKALAPGRNKALNLLSPPLQLFRKEPLPHPSEDRPRRCAWVRPGQGCELPRPLRTLRRYELLCKDWGLASPSPVDCHLVTCSGSSSPRSIQGS